MRRLSHDLLIPACLIALLLACFGGVLFGNRQFGYRDAAHYYYPLYQRVQAEWNAGRWPLWEPEENSGMPLLGNPTAAVLYPGKIIYALLPYAWGARVYVIAHVVLAFVAMLALMRSWGTSWTGSGLSALAYAFGVPILFQYCNIIFLVGAAWIPLGFHAADRWLRLGRRSALLELAVVLVMQTLGGDPESSYVMGICAGGYALGLSWLERRQGKHRTIRWQTVALIAVVCVCVWAWAVLALAQVLPRYRTRHNTPLPLPWMPLVPAAVAGIWVVAGLLVVAGWLRSGRKSRLFPRLAGLLGAAVLAGMLGGAQLLPVFEFTRQSGRAAGSGPHDVYPFGLEPFRVVEMVWPNVFGNAFAANRSWLTLASPAKYPAKVWIPSLYLGGLTGVLALGALGFRGGPPWRGWLTVVAGVSLLGAMGQYTGPIGWARQHDYFTQRLGPPDASLGPALRFDGQLRDGDGGVYWGLATVLPGFRQFRFPSKLLSFTVLALCALAGMGWDRLTSAPGCRRRAMAATTLFFVPSLIGLPLTLATHARITAAFENATTAENISMFGPFDAKGAARELEFSLAQAVVVYALALGILRLSGRRPEWAGALALVVLASDLGWANARYVITVPQAMFDGTPQVVSIIEKAERTAKDRSTDPYRVHRAAIWNPYAWMTQRSDERVKEFVAWERKTIQPKYGINHGVQFTLAMGVAELYDYEWYFGPFYQTLDASEARQLKARAGDRLVVYPRRAYDMWNSRYFIVPVNPGGWGEEHRSYAAFLGDVERIFPAENTFSGRGADQRQRDWVETEDYQIFRNRHCFPRAWVVHEVRPVRTVVGLDRTGREGPMEEILFENDHFWEDSSKMVFDPRRTAWIDEAELPALRGSLAGGPPLLGEKAAITHYSPQRVELDVTLDRPGLVVLAEVWYPGWQLTIDGREAPVYRANRAMRGAAVPSGKHHLVYTYAPRSFRDGCVISLGGLAVLAVLGVAARCWPVSPSLVSPLNPQV